MDWTSLISLSAICIVWGTSLYAECMGGRSSSYAVRFARWGLFGSFLIIICVFTYLSREQFLIWQGNGLSKYLIPPYREISYFGWYVYRHIWAPYMLSACAAILIACAAVYANRRRGGVFFEAEEPYFIAFGIFMIGYPGWVAYLLLVLSAYLFVSVGHRLVSGVAGRTSFYRFWLPCAAIAFLVKAYLIRYGWYSDLFI